jgi:hypothetical protein
MRVLGKQATPKQWARFAMKCGLLVTDPKLWASIDEQLKESADNVSHILKRRYEDTRDRLDEAGGALRGESDWATPVASFLGGIAFGLGLGMLFAPLSGEETRAALRNKAADVRDKVGDIATAATRFRSPSTGTPSTGTVGD